MKKVTINLKGTELQNDNVFVESKIVSLSDLTNTPTRKGLEMAVISAGKIVNVVSDNYGHLPNEDFFLKVEESLINADVQYITRSINKDNRSFAVDYILNDDNYIIEVNGSIKDKIRPMLRFVNAYDGSNKTSGFFGYFREVCSNGLNVAESNIGFAVKKSGAICQIVLPEIKHLVNKFMSNEYYTLKNKFDTLQNTKISDVALFVKKVCDETKIIKFEASDKNPAPSKKASDVIDAINSEARLLGTDANLWLGYNNLNELLCNGLSKNFEQQRTIDKQLFNTVLEMA